MTDRERQVSPTRAPVLRDTTGELELRQANSTDSDFAFRILSTAFRPYIERDTGWDEDHQRQQHQRRFAKYDYRVICLDGVACGVMSLDITPSEIKLNQIFLAPEYQGQGIGARCMGLIVDLSDRYDLPVRLRVMKVNPRALTFYRRLGFSVIETAKTHYVLKR